VQELGGLSAGRSLSNPTANVQGCAQAHTRWRGQHEKGVT
jgi:hypothetical protein